jgi:trimethylamine--corrinoid protein Co-methyltransferase
MLDAYLELGQWDVPVMMMPMPVAGTTGPASLFANIALANAELLSSVVVYQLANPGRPLIYSSAVGSLDFRTGGFLGGTPEMGIQSAALTEMGHFYNLPATSAGCTADAKQPGAEAVLEKLVTTIPPVLAGSEIIVGFGEIESDQLQVLEQYLVDHELARYSQRLLEGVDSGEGKELFEDIASIGPGGHFLGRRSTRQAPRSGEFFFPSLLDYHSYEAWLELGKPSMYSKAREKVKEILAGPVIDPLPEAITARLDEILQRADRELTD